MTKIQFTAFAAHASDYIERLMVESGFLDQLSFLVGKTSLVRQFILTVAGTWFGATFAAGDLGQALVAAAVAVITGLIGVFIERVRLKYNTRTLTLAQAAAPEVGVKVDNFIGPKAVEALAKVTLGRAVGAGT